MSSPAALTPFFVGGGYNYQISRSVRLRSSASAYFNRTPAITANTQWTYSVWLKRGVISNGNNDILSASSALTSHDTIFFSASDTLTFVEVNSGVTNWQLTTTQVFRDPSAWYHFVIAYDSTQATASNRVKLYVNGVQITSFLTANYPALNNTSYIGWSSASHTIGRFAGSSSEYFDGYMAEINYVSGLQLAPSSFGYTDSNGIWQPKAYTGTYGTNGFYLKFTDNSAATAAAIGKDYSGNGNNWTPNNISVTAGVTYDSMIDSPTVGYAASNYAVLNPLSAVGSATVSNGNLLGTVTSSSASGIFASIACNGKNYCETKGNAFGTAVIAISCFTTISAASGAQYYSDGRLYVNNSLQGTYATFSSGDTIAIDVDTSTRQIRFYKNNVQIGSTGTASGTDPLFFAVTGSGAGTGSASTFFNFGQSAFTYTPPSGYSALNTYNLPAATINNGATVMAASAYTGNGSTQSIANSASNAAAVSFKPDLVWTKARNVAYGHVLYDSVRGALKFLESDATNAEVNGGTGLTSFDANGFTTTAYNGTNATGTTYVGWQWQAGQGTTSSNTNGSITSTVSVNQSAGFSVSTFATAGANATIGHGLGVAPSLIIMKDRTNAAAWLVYHSGLGSPANYLVLNTTAASASNTTVWNNTTPTSSVFSIGTVWAASNYVAYCWSQVAGYSKFGSYTGNGSADGPFIYCGFRPRFILIKDASSGVTNWIIHDTSRDTYNQVVNSLAPNSTAIESVYASSYGIDVTANGFKIRLVGSPINTTSDTHIFAAFAENPFNISRAR